MIQGGAGNLMSFKGFRPGFRGLARALLSLGLVMGSVGSLSSGSALAYSLKQLLANRLDPAATYHTVVTDHFEIHFPDDLSDIIPHLAQVSESVHRKVTKFLAWDPT